MDSALKTFYSQRDAIYVGQVCWTRACLRHSLHALDARKVFIMHKALPLHDFMTEIVSACISPWHLDSMDKKERVGQRWSPLRALVLGRPPSA